MSWTSEAPRASGSLGGSNNLVLLTGSLVVAVGSPLLGNELTNRLILDAGPSGIDIRSVFFLTSALVDVGLAAAVFAAFATRLPFAGVGIALAASVLRMADELVRGHAFFGVGEQILWVVLLGSLCLLGADLVVWARRGLPLGLTLALVGALAAAALTILVDLATFMVHGVPLSFLMDNWRLVVQLVVEMPVILLIGGGLGWWLQRQLNPTSARPPRVDG